MSDDDKFWTGSAGRPLTGTRMKEQGDCGEKMLDG